MLQGRLWRSCKLPEVASLMPWGSPIITEWNLPVQTSDLDGWWLMLEGGCIFSFPFPEASEFFLKVAWYFNYQTSESTTGASAAPNFPTFLKISRAMTSRRVASGRILPWKSWRMTDSVVGNGKYPRKKMDFPGGPLNLVRPHWSLDMLRFLLAKALHVKLHFLAFAF